MDLLLNLVTEGGLLQQGSKVDAAKLAGSLPRSTRAEVFRRAVARLERDGILSQESDGSIRVRKLTGREAVRALRLRALAEVSVVRRLMTRAEESQQEAGTRCEPPRDLSSPLELMKADIEYHVGLAERAGTSTAALAIRGWANVTRVYLSGLGLSREDLRFIEECDLEIDDALERVRRDREERDRVERYLTKYFKSILALLTGSSAPQPISA